MPRSAPQTRGPCRPRLRLLATGRTQSSVGIGETGRSTVRLAELVAALSLGIDLGFGQPMEHVLRQCLIALRLAERLGLDDEQRAVVYYTALLVNVGCHTDAHEQAKWFGDDIALKSTKYEYELRSLRGDASGMRRLGPGSPPLHRFRLGLDVRALGPPRGRPHDRPPRRDGARARGAARAARTRCSTRSSAAYEMWDGKGWPGELAGEAIPLAARLAQLGGVRRGRAPRRRRRGGRGARAGAPRRQFDPTLCDVLDADAAD